MIIRPNSMKAIRFTRCIHIGRVVPEVDPSLAEALADPAINLKKIRTRRNMGLLRLPVRLEMAASTKIKSTTDRNFRSDAHRLINIMYNIKAPDDRHSLELKRADIKTELEVRDKIKERPDYQPDEFRLQEEFYGANLELKQLISGTLADRRRDWHHYEYDDYASYLYMAVRLAPNYVCLKTIMDEIKALQPDFKPRSVLDFGSGLGTSIWAIDQTWHNTVEEFMNIDISKNQQYLCEYLLRGGTDSGPLLNHVYHKQYLSTSNRVKYDIVISAFSMLELPNSESRAHVIENLWHKTKDFLIIVERGNQGGFTMIKEARNLVLDMTGHKVTRPVFRSSIADVSPFEQLPQSHVFAPCPHEFLCPKIKMTTKGQRDVCRYPVSFEPLEIGENKKGFIRDNFSYIVLRKGPHPNLLDSRCYRYPRAVERRSKSNAQVTHHICCPNGTLADTVITKKKYGKAAFDVAKACDWGDTIPIKVHDSYNKNRRYLTSGGD